MKCMQCNSLATLVNHTQFAGSHYWCDSCVPKEDKAECTKLAVCKSPYCECPKNRCREGKLDGRGQESYSQPDKTQYLLDKLQEEAAEVIQAVSKIRRFGKLNRHPDRSTTNIEELVGELEDLQAIVLALEEINYFDPKPSTVAVIKKFNTLMAS